MINAVLILVLFGSSILLIVGVLLWFYYPALYDLPAVAARPERIRKALELVKLQPGEVLYDLGAGDGRVLLMAARDFGARAVGIEIGPLQCVWIGLRIAAGGLRERVQVRWGNFYKAELHDADVVYVYATSRAVGKLASFLAQQMKPGARLVSIMADFPEWEPSAFDERGLIFVYDMPPTRGSLTTYLMKRAK